MQIQSLSTDAGEAAGRAICATAPNPVLFSTFLPRDRKEHTGSIDARFGIPTMRQLAVMRAAAVHADESCTDSGRCP